MPFLRCHNMLHIVSNNRGFTLKLIFFLAQFRSFMIRKRQRKDVAKEHLCILKENSFLGVHVATKLVAKAASEQIWNSTKSWNYQTTRAGFWKCIWVISTKDNLNKTVIFFYTQTSVDICSNSSIPESLKPLKDFQISVHKKMWQFNFCIMDRHPKQMTENTLQKIVWIHRTSTGGRESLKCSGHLRLEM